MKIGHQKEKYDFIRGLEMSLNIAMKQCEEKLGCRFCNDVFSRKSSLNRHIKTCKAKQEYKEKLEAQVAKQLCFQRLSQ